MNNDDLVRLLDGRKEIVIFGAGISGTYIFELLRQELPGSHILFCDNDHKKQGTVDGRTVLSVKEAVRQYGHAIFLIPRRIDEDVMRSQLLMEGAGEDAICEAETVELEAYLHRENLKKNSTPLEEIQFEVDIASHCNLNCKCCSQFSCIAEEEFIDLDVMERDFQRMGELFGGKAKRIYLIGGEPLLFPEIAECMRIARTYFQTGDISVFTNGLLLPKCSPDFWEACRKYGISIITTKYPLQADYRAMEQTAKKECVDFQFFGTSEDFKYMCNLRLRLEGDGDARKNFSACVEANNCIKLKNGKLYTCTRPAAIYKFNRYFGKHLEVTAGDSVDIYRAFSGREILEKLAKPIPFCRYCDMFGEARTMPWGCTERKIEEWL